MKAAIFILGFGISLMVLSTIVMVKEQKKTNEMRQKYENLKAKSDAFDRHLEVCDSVGLYFFKKNNINQHNHE